MARFSFRLERVLSVRRHEEEREKLLFGESVRRRQDALEGLERITVELARSLETAPREGDTAPLESLVMDYEYRVSLHARRMEAERLLATRETELEAARLSLLAAQRRRRALELLRESQFRRWKYEEENREQNDIEELALASHSRRSEERRAAEEASTP